MNKIILFILIISVFNVKAQFDDTLKYDSMEAFDWAGNWWSGVPTTGFFTNASRSAPASAVIYGSGNNNQEFDWYSLPNESGLDPSIEYKLQVNLGSYRFTGGGSAGVDVGDYIEIQVSTDGGVTYISELRITGNSNSYWDYNSATVTKLVDGILDVSGPNGGGDRTNTGDGWSRLELIFPLGTTQIAVDILSVVNRAGEEWWIDDIFLLGNPGTALPIELVSFDATALNNKVHINWSTASQTMNEYFTVQRSVDGYEWVDISEIKGCGDCNTQIDYLEIDSSPPIGVVYYRLMQTDFDGESEIFNAKSVIVKDNRSIGLYITPNPAIDNIQLNLISRDGLIPTRHDITIYNDMGDEVFKNFYIGKLQYFDIDIKGLKSGYYIIKSNSNGLSGYGNFIKF
jgi:hypothetical protein